MKTKTAEEAERPVIELAKPPQLVFNAEETSARLGRIVSAIWLERQAAAAAIPCTYIGGHLGFAEEHIQALIASGFRDPATHGRKTG